LLTEIADGLGGRPDEVPVAYLQQSALWLADNLLHVGLVVRGSAGDDLVDGRVHVGRFAARLDELGYAHRSSVTDAGTHCDANTIEGLYEQAIELLLTRPSVDPSPDRVVYRSADLRWPRAYWLELVELSGESARVDAHRDRAANTLDLHVEGAGRVRIDAAAAGLTRDARVSISADRSCMVDLVGADWERTISSD
jgi:hypothetical protein